MSIRWNIAPRLLGDRKKRTPPPCTIDRAGKCTKTCLRPRCNLFPVETRITRLRGGLRLPETTCGWCTDRRQQRPIVLVISGVSSSTSGRSSSPYREGITNSKDPEATASERPRCGASTIGRTLDTVSKSLTARARPRPRCLREKFPLGRGPIGFTAPGRVLV